MELQLSLELPVHTPTNIGFDLINREANELRSQDLLSRFGRCSKEVHGHFKRKHGLAAEEFDQDGVDAETFPLVSWIGNPNEEDDSEEQRKKRKSVSSSWEYGHPSLIVGWPPINSWRKKLIHEHHGGEIANGRMADGGRTNSTFVKVRMEGVAIGRKIDLNLYHSYQMLTITLINMFAKYQETEKDGDSYTLLYQDKEGNWLLAGEIPWPTFIESVQRVEVVRKIREE